MIARSQNGWPANRIASTKVWTIPGTTRRIRLNGGDAGFLLVDFAAWFHRHIEPVDTGQLDDWGYAERPIRGSARTLSNHASGTAIDLNAAKHPMGCRGTFTDVQVRAIRERLRVYDGAIRWGGDYKGRPDEMHFEINASGSAVAAVARRIRGEITVEQADRIISELRKDVRYGGHGSAVLAASAHKAALGAQRRAGVNMRALKLLAENIEGLPEEVRAAIADALAEAGDDQPDDAA